MVADDLHKLSLSGNLGEFSEDTCLIRHQSVNEVVFARAEALGHLDRSDDQLLDAPDFGALGHAGALAGFVGSVKCNLDAPNFFREWEAVEYLLCAFVGSVSAHD